LAASKDSIHKLQQDDWERNIEPVARADWAAYTEGRGPDPRQPFANFSDSHAPLSERVRTLELEIRELRAAFDAVRQGLIAALASIAPARR
jgi:hypothetical protein